MFKALKKGQVQFNSTRNFQNHRVRAEAIPVGHFGVAKSIGMVFIWRQGRASSYLCLPMGQCWGKGVCLRAGPRLEPVIAHTVIWSNNTAE